MIGELATAQATRPRAAAGPRRTASIAGRIIHADGTAAEGARVAVYAVRDGVAAAIAGTATSSYDGRYEVKGLVAGEYMVGVTARKTSGVAGDLKRTPAMPLETFYPGTTERDRADAVTVFEALPAEGIDVWLAPAPQRFAISGRIFPPDGVALEKTVIEYAGAGGVRRGIWYVHDPGGLFTIDGAAQGTYVLLVRAETPVGPLVGIAATDVSVGPVEDVRVMLRTPGSMEGRIVIDATAAKASPSPTLRVSPRQLLVELSPLYPVEETAVADDGRFTLRELGGEYAIVVHGLPDGWRVKRVQHNGAPLPGNRIVVPPGERVTGVEVVVGVGTT
jgi:hypothetical protein